MRPCTGARACAQCHSVCVCSACVRRYTHAPTVGGAALPQGRLALSPLDVSLSLGLANPLNRDAASDANEQPHSVVSTPDLSPISTAASPVCSASVLGGSASAASPPLSPLRAPGPAAPQGVPSTEAAVHELCQQPARRRLPLPAPQVPVPRESLSMVGDLEWTGAWNRRAAAAVGGSVT